MQNLLRRHLLALMLGVTAMTYTASAVLIDAPAFAKNGADDGPGHDAGDDHGGDSGDSGGSDDSDDDDNSGSGSDDDDDDDNSGSGSDDRDDDDSDDDDNSGSGSDDDDDSNDDNSNNRSKSKSNKAAKGSNPARPTTTITLTAASLASVQSGTHVVVDQLGRQLEIRVLTINGQQVIRAKPHGGDAKRKPGPITTINVVPVSTVGGTGNDDGTPDQGPGDN